MTSHNPFLNRNTDYGKKSEKRVSRKLGATQTPASGALLGAKGDMDAEWEDKWKIEAKSTAADSMNVRLAWLQKISKEAVEVGSYPALTVSFVTQNGEVRREGDWVMVPQWVFDLLKESK